MKMTKDTKSDIQHTIITPVNQKSARSQPEVSQKSITIKTECWTYNFTARSTTIQNVSLNYFHLILLDKWTHIYIMYHGDII